MKQRIQHLVCATTVIAIGGLLAQIDGQRRPAGQAAAKQGIQASLKVGGQTYESNEPGRCTHAPTASIYQVVSQLWSVQQSSQGRSLTLTFWKPKDGSAEMVNLSVRNGDASHGVNTVRGGGATSGTGKVTFDKSGDGGTFTVEAKTKAGTVITGRITCDAFAPHTAEGGL
jgi:hypothetical protein